MTLQGHNYLILHEQSSTSVDYFSVLDVAGRRDELFMRLRKEGMGTCRVVYFGLLFGIDLITI